MFNKIVFSAALVGLSGCASMATSDTGVRQGMAAFQDAFNQRDATSLGMIYTEDARLMPINAPVMTGRAAIQSYWQAGFARGVSHIEKTPIEVQVIGETAIEMSRYVATVGERKLHGKDMLVWRRGNDGVWRIAADIWNNDQP